MSTCSAWETPGALQYWPVTPGEEPLLYLVGFLEQMGSEESWVGFFLREKEKRLHVPFREAVPGKSSLG